MRSALARALPLPIPARALLPLVLARALALLPLVPARAPRPGGAARIMTRGGAALALVLVLALPAGPTSVHAAGSGAGAGITGVQVGYGFAGGGNYRANGPSLLQPNDVWVPVHVTLHNAGNSDVDGRLVISTVGQQNGNGTSYQTEYTLAVSLPAGARKAATMYVRAADLAASLTVKLKAGNTLLDASTATPGLQKVGALSVGILSDDTAARALFRGLTFGDGDTTLSVAQFDDAVPLDTQPQALENFDLIVLTNYSSDALRGDQMAALRAWVQGGGTLLVAGGPDAQKTMGHLAPDLLAATLRSALPATAPSVPELARIAGASALRGNAGASGGRVEYSVAAPRPGAAVLAAHNGVPLVVDRPLGRGHLVYSAIEPTLAPFNAWPLAAQGAFWTHLLAPALTGPLDALVQSGAQNNASNPNGQPLTGIANDLGTLPSRSLPSLQNYTFLIVLYILVLGPGNYILLRWRRRLEWSWVTVPVVAVLFCVGSFGLAYARNGGDVLANIDTVLYLDPGAATRSAASYIGLFAPFHGNYTLSTPGPALAWGLGGDSSAQSVIPGQTPLGLSIEEGPQFSAQLFNLQMWSMRTIVVQQQLAVSGQVTARLVLHGNTVSGTVTNGTDLALHDCAIVGLSGASSPLPVLLPGRTVRVPPFSLSGTGGGSGGSGAQPLNTLYSAAVGGLQAAGTGGLQAAGSGSLAPAGRYNSVLNAIFPNGTLATAAVPVALVGWSTAPLGQFSVNGTTPHRSDLDLIVAPLQLATAPGRFKLAPGDLPVGVLDTTVSPGATGPGSTLTLNSGDRIDVELALPHPATTGRVHVDTLAVQANFNGGTSLTSNGAALWNWTTGRWVTVDLSSGALTVRRAAAFVSPDGRVRLRLLAPSNGSLTFNNVVQNVQIGAIGSVR